jgi:hypothetical protein
VAGAVVVAQNLDLSWYTIDGGGEMFSSGGTLELSGTIGQPDAGVVMTGGDLELIGGFWGVATAPCLGQLCGDCSCDGAFNGGDIDPFFLALGDPDEWKRRYPDCDIICVADINYDGLVNGADINPFFDALGAGACP